jgi:GntR family transcriptional regulator
MCAITLWRRYICGRCVRGHIAICVLAAVIEAVIITRRRAAFDLRPRGLYSCLMSIGQGGRSAGGDASPSGARGPVSPIEFRLDRPSGVPTYLQLVHQVEHALRLGYLKPGDQLPKVRDVVASLAINPNTVSKAYRELETKGLIVGRPGQGTFILATLSQVALPELTGLRRSLHSWLAKAETAGLDEHGIVALVASELRDFYECRSGSRRSAGSAATEGVA